MWFGLQVHAGGWNIIKMFFVFFCMIHLPHFQHLIKRPNLLFHSHQKILLIKGWEICISSLLIKLQYSLMHPILFYSNTRLFCSPKELGSTTSLNRFLSDIYCKFTLVMSTLFCMENFAHLYKIALHEKHFWVIVAPSLSTLLMIIPIKK